MMNARVVEREFLDELSPSDPRAVRSRRDLRLCNALMFQPTIMARLMARQCSKSPRTMVDIGSGDGTAALAMARRLAHLWPSVSLTLVDRQDIVSAATLAEFARLGWQVERQETDVFEFFGTSPKFDLVTANLFLHHFPDPRLKDLLEKIAQSTRVLVCGEPRRGAAAAVGCRFLPLFGCNEITLHDSVASVRAGFRGKELSDLWVRDGAWRLAEHPALPFTHCFTAALPETETSRDL
jgi:SAM-dependent methyltransferase